MSRFLLSLPDPLHESLRLAATLRGQPMSDVVRAALRAELNRIRAEAVRRGAPDPQPRDHHHHV